MKRYYERLKEEAPKIENIYIVAFGENAEIARTLVKGLITKSKGEQETREIARTIMSRMKTGLEEYTEIMEEEDGNWEATLYRGKVEYTDVERWGIFKSICCKYDGACDQIEETLRLMAIKAGYLKITSAEEEFDEDNEVDDADKEWENLLGSLLLAAE